MKVWQRTSNPEDLVPNDSLDTRLANAMGRMGGKTGKDRLGVPSGDRRPQPQVLRPIEQHH
jgi:hypothetical protein